MLCLAKLAVLLSLRHTYNSLSLVKTHRLNQLFLAPTKQEHGLAESRSRKNVLFVMID